MNTCFCRLAKIYTLTYCINLSSIYHWLSTENVCSGFSNVFQSGQHVFASQLCRWVFLISCEFVILLLDTIYFIKIFNGPNCLHNSLCYTLFSYSRHSDKSRQDKSQKIIPYNDIMHSVSTNNMTRHLLSDTRLDLSLENLTSKWMKIKHN